LPLIHILEGTKKMPGIENSVDMNELLREYDKLKQRLDNLKNKRDPNDSEGKKLLYDQLNWSPIYEHLEHLKEAIDNFAGDRIETQTKGKGFRIKLWDRDPAKDMFQGNYTHCCIAVGVKDAPPEGGLTTHDPATIFHYLVDKGIQVAEVLDESRRDPIAQVWLFVTKNEYGEPVLVADNFEVHRDYTGDQAVNNAIRDKMFEFLANYAQKCQIDFVGLGRVSTNDVAYNDLPILKVPPIDKVGGYLKDYTSQTVRPGRYYLEAYNHQELAEVYNGQKEKERDGKQEEKEAQKRKGAIVIFDVSRNTNQTYQFTPELLREIEEGRRPDIFSDKDFQRLNEIENSSFGPLAADQDTILIGLKNREGVQLLFRDKNGQLAGYLSSIPAEIGPAVFEYIGLNDSQFIADDKTLYLWSIAGRLEGVIFDKVLDILKKEAAKAGYRKLSMHGFNKKLNKILLKRYGFRKIREIENCLAGQKADYMELDLAE